MLLSERFPVLYPISLWRLRTLHSLKQWANGIRFATTYQSDDLPERMFRHQSLLLRKLGDSDPQLQRNKVQNLKVAAKAMDGIIIRPGETFSLWKTLGRSTRRKGYVEGMLLASGQVRVGVGGGLCQLANLLYWMALHTPLEVTERYHHSFDAFPDQGRTLPFGSGATIFYNYVDLKIYNPTDQAWQVRVWVGDEHLKGEMRCERLPTTAYSVFERDHAFVQEGDGRIFRKNKIWRMAYERRGGRELYAEFVTGNYAEVKYALSPEIAADVVREAA